VVVLDTVVDIAAGPAVAFSEVEIVVLEVERLQNFFVLAAPLLYWHFGVVDLHCYTANLHYPIPPVHSLSYHSNKYRYSHPCFDNNNQYPDNYLVLFAALGFLPHLVLLGPVVLHLRQLLKQGVGFRLNQLVVFPLPVLLQFLELLPHQFEPVFGLVHLQTVSPRPCCNRIVFEDREIIV